jgi:hypothetical protein
LDKALRRAKGFCTKLSELSVFMVLMAKTMRNSVFRDIRKFSPVKCTEFSEKYFNSNFRFEDCLSPVFILVPCLAYILILKKEMIFSSETIDFREFIQCCIQIEPTVHFDFFF